MRPDARSAVLPLRHVVVGPIPPPTHGYALANLGLVRMLQEAGVEPQVIDLAATGNLIRYHASRLKRVIGAAWALMLERRFRGEPVRVHLGCDGGYGLLYTLLLTCAARISGCVLRLHHHSYARIGRRSALLSLLILLAGRRAIHVALRQPMAEALGKTYARARVVTLSNAAFIHPGPVPEPEATANNLSGKTFSIGMIGNLGSAKGLPYFLALTDALRLRYGPAGVQALLAGPLSDRTDRAAVRRRVNSGSLHWLGPLRDDERTDSFYSQIDLLIFPSQYVHEAEPFVVLEALAHGVAPIASDRGCIADLVGDAGIIIPAHCDFVRACMTAIAQLTSDPPMLLQMRMAARARFIQLHGAALTEAHALLELDGAGRPDAAPVVAVVADRRDNLPPSHSMAGVQDD